jgi:hypothetical protein
VDLGEIRWLVALSTFEREEGRPLAHEWLVQLLVGSDGKVTDWPDWYWEMIAAVEGRPVAVSTDAARTPWGPAAP